MSSPDQFIGSSIGKYNLIEFLGEGGMAKVYKGYHPDLQRFAAIKILHTEYLNDEKFISRFKNEAQNLAVLRHPNIVQVYDASITKNFPYLIMEFVEGKTLKQFIQEYNQSQKRIPITYTLRIIYSLGLALSFAHRNNMIHRDVKPSNIILETSGRVVLTDFGLAEFQGQPESQDAPMVEGTPAYISPEQALGRGAKPRSDQYSLGLVFFEMLTGRRPYVADDAIDMALRHATNDIPSPQEYYPEIPEEVSQIVLRATRKNPEERYPTISDLLKDLIKVRIKSKTAKLPTASLKDLKLSSDRVASWAAPDYKLSDRDSVVCLHFVDTGQVMDLELNREYLIGRQHRSQPIIPDIDLSPFKAYDWGISRLHASIAIQMNQVTITDLGSANGTWHAGKRLPPNQPYPLKHGDVIHLGKLKTQILIYM
ncbi:protein kinase [bacterium]|nr:protein kinase [bacterium]MCB2179239.1 protein kinase [bacterium]